MDHHRRAPVLPFEHPQNPPRARGNTPADQPEDVCRVHVGVPNDRPHTEKQS